MIFFFSFFLLKDADLLDIESKHFEDLEFQQLEHESRLDEEKENLTQQLLREVAEYQRSIVSRKVNNTPFLCSLLLSLKDMKWIYDLPICKK